MRVIFFLYNKQNLEWTRIIQNKLMWPYSDGYELSLKSNFEFFHACSHFKPSSLFNFESWSKDVFKCMKFIYILFNLNCIILYNYTYVFEEQYFF